MQVGITLNPLTPLNAIEEALPLVDLVLIMSVEPGFGGQSYIPGATQRIKRMRQMLDAIGSKAELQVDGGINASTIREVRDAGASMVVVGSALYTPKHGVAQGMDAMRRALA
jgi:ribulose-phosphate 3-epimerase